MSNEGTPRPVGSPELDSDALSSHGPGGEPRSCLTDEQLEAAAGSVVIDASVAAHILGCHRCRAAVEQIKANDAFLANIGPRLPFNDQPAREAAPPAPGLALPSLGGSAPALVGDGLLSSCRILSEVHRGGQGIVYKALHTTTGRKVAIKTLIEGALASPAQQRRFEREMEIVANLRHPSIVTLYETGVLPDGRMAFAMEYVNGVPIDQWARELSTRSGERSSRAILVARLEVFARVCDAVQHAHQHGVIHRDLKPGNILVDAEDIPHVLDFGLAKVTLGTERGRDLDPTMTGDFRGSLAYASPEQIGRNPERVDTRSDVYSLGAILYEIVTGRRVCRQESSIAELVRAITAEVPAPPASICRDVDDELETIVLRMLAKEPAQRYQSAGAVRDDLHRYLAGKPIDAKRDSSWYLIRMAFRRHRRAAIVAILALVAAATLLVSISRARAIEQQARETRKEVDWALRVVEQLLSAQTPEDPWSVQVDVKFWRRLLDSLVARLDELHAPPIPESAVRHLIGRQYRVIGSADLAVQQLDRAATLRTHELGELHPDTLASKSELVEALLGTGKRSDAERLLRELIPPAAIELGPFDAAVLRMRHLLALVLLQQNRVPEALAASLACHADCKTHLGAAHELTLDSAALTVTLLRREKRYSEALELGSETTRTWESLHGRDHPKTVAAMQVLGAVLGMTKRFDEAQKLYEAALQSCERHLGKEHLDTAAARHNLAVLRLRRGQFDLAAQEFRELVGVRQRRLGDNHAATLKSMQQLAEAENELGNTDASVAMYEQIIAIYRSGRIDDPNGVAVALVAMRELGVLLTKSDRLAEAEKLLDECVRTMIRMWGPTDGDSQRAVAALIRVHEAAGRPERAELLRNEFPTVSARPEPAPAR